MHFLSRFSARFSRSAWLFIAFPQGVLNISHRARSMRCVVYSVVCVGTVYVRLDSDTRPRVTIDINVLILWWTFMEAFDLTRRKWNILLICPKMRTLALNSRKFDSRCRNKYPNHFPNVFTHWHQTFSFTVKYHILEAFVYTRQEENETFWFFVLNWDSGRQNPRNFFPDVATSTRTISQIFLPNDIQTLNFVVKYHILRSYTVNDKMKMKHSAFLS